MPQEAADIPVMTFATDADGRCVHLDDAWLEFSGQRPEEALGFGWLAAVHPNERSRSEARLRMALASRSPIRQEHRMRRADGVYRSLLVVGAPRFDPNGDFVGYVGSLIDVEDRRETQAALAESEELHRILLTALADGVFVAQDHRFVFANPAMALMLGYTLPEFLDLPFQAVIAGEDLPLWTTRYEARVADGPEPTQHYAVRLLRKSGDRLETELSARRIRYKGRNAVLGVIRDLTERRRTETALQASEARYRLLHEMLRDAYVQVDMDGRIVEVNELYVKMLGYSRSELRGLTYQQLTPERWHEAESKIVEEQIIPRGYSDVYEKEYRRKDGTIFPVEFRTVLSRDEHGEPASMWAIVRDVSERKRIERELQEASRRKDEFLATLAHELRNPLAPIYNGVQLLQREAGEKANARNSALLAMMRRQAEHLVRLVDDLIEISRITRGKIELRRERTDIGSVINLALETSQPQIEKAQHRVSLRLPDEPLPIHADPVRLSQALSNLVGNAAKFTPPGGHIVIEAERQGARALIRVRDNGRGMPPGALPYVFDLFTQIDNRGQDGGLGIGLAMVRQLVELHGGEVELVELHGGEVEAHSEGPDKGSEFTVALPLETGALRAPSRP